MALKEDIPEILDSSESLSADVIFRQLYTIIMNILLFFIFVPFCFLIQMFISASFIFSQKTFFGGNFTDHLIRPFSLSLYHPSMRRTSFSFNCFPFNQWRLNQALSPQGNLSETNLSGFNFKLHMIGHFQAICHWVCGIIHRYLYTLMPDNKSVCG